MDDTLLDVPGGCPLSSTLLHVKIFVKNMYVNTGFEVFFWFFSFFCSRCSMVFWQGSTVFWQGSIVFWQGSTVFWQGSTVFWQALDFRARVIYLFNRNFAKFSKKVYVLIKIARKKRTLFQFRRDGQQKAYAF